VISVAWGTVPDWLVAVGTFVIVWELWRDPKKKHFGKERKDSG
jgi:hypothetical protein